MQIRRIGSNVPDNVAPCYTLLEQTEHYYVAEYCGTVKALAKAEYEAVPEERWVDVTAQCMTCYATGNNGTVLQVFGDTVTVAKIHKSYRLRHVQVWQTAHNNDAMTGQGLMAAFIVERKEPQ